MEWVYEICLMTLRNEERAALMAEICVSLVPDVYPVFSASRRESLIMSCAERRRETGTRDHFGMNFFDSATQNSSHFDMLNNGHVLKSFTSFVLYYPPFIDLGFRNEG